MSRMTGDAARDLDTKLPETVAELLQEAGSAKSWREMVLTPKNLSDKDASKMLGEALPVGLRLES